MGKDCCTLTVYFDEPFWVGVFEKETHGKLSACKVTFGAEPKDFEVYEFVLKHYCQLQFSPAVKTAVKKSIHNAKRIQREVKKALNSHGIATKSQQALKLQQEQIKQERKVKSRTQKQAKAQQMFMLKQQKKKDRHKGR